MLTCQKLSKKPDVFRRFTGLTVEEFDALHALVERRYPAAERRRLSKRKRVKAIGQGGKFTRPLQERLLALLVYCRVYPSYAFLGYLFGIDESNILRNIAYLEPLVRRCIPLPEKLSRGAKRVSSMEQLLALFPDAKAILDATEQEIQRPQDPERRKTHYSGKKKRHTVKTQLLVNVRGLILDRSASVAGRVHDYALFKEATPAVPAGVEVLADSGYQGIAADFPGLRSRIPRKKPKGRELSRADKRFNHALARERVIVEHAIRRAKTFRIWGDTFRNRLEHHDGMASLVAGLVNFKTLMRDGADMRAFVG